MKIELPIRTVSEANRASHEHWSKRQKRTKYQRGLTKLCVAALRPKPHSIYEVTGRGERIAREWFIVLTRIAPRVLDDDNLRGALKACRDGVADAIGLDDGSPLIRWEYAQRKGLPKQYAIEVEFL